MGKGARVALGKRELIKQNEAILDQYQRTALLLAVVVYKAGGRVVVDEETRVKFAEVGLNALNVHISPDLNNQNQLVINSDNSLFEEKTDDDEDAAAVDLGEGSEEEDGAGADPSNQGELKLDEVPGNSGEL